jgi:predicted FMN-binding regulatory protein PaiB
MAILVANLPSQVTQADLISLFTKYGKVQKINIFPTVGYAVVEIEGEEDETHEEHVIQELNSAETFGQKLQLFKSAQVETDEEPGDTRDPKANPPKPPKPPR